jgi:hypothetical protein
MYIPSSVTPSRAAYMGISTVSMRYSNKSGIIDILGGLYTMGLSTLDYKFDYL